jgi:carboxyl-terminal processing protease
MLKANLQNIRKWVVILFSAGLIFGLGYYTGGRGLKVGLGPSGSVAVSRITPSDKNVDFSLFWKVWDILGSSYFDKSKLVNSNMVYGAIAGMVSSLGDPYTVFLPPSENKIVEEDLGSSFEGVGIQIGYKGTQLAVVAPIPGSPAEAVGVKAGDFIMGIKDASKGLEVATVGMNLAEAVKDIRGPAGTKVTLTLLRDNDPKPIIVDIVREKLTVPSVSVTYAGKDNQIAVIKLTKFGADTETEWQKAVNEMVAKNDLKGIVLDLRNNPGGYLEEAVRIGGEFLKTNAVVVIEEKASGARTDYRVDRVGRLTSTPLMVVINGGSASASEILAGALRDVRRIKLVGEASFGKGTIQEPQDLTGGAGLHVTIAKWLTPSGFWVNGKGLEPDVKIVNEENSTTDKQLEEAIKLLE